MSIKIVINALKKRIKPDVRKFIRKLIMDTKLINYFLAFFCKPLFLILTLFPA